MCDKNVQKEYKKSGDNRIKHINLNDQKTAKKLKLDDRIHKTEEKNAFVTLKDHKPNFINNPTCRLLNPTKSNIGRISKQILENVNSRVRKLSGLNQ